MTPKITDEQRQALVQHRGAPVQVIDPVTNRAFVLLPAEEYERMRAQLLAEMGSTEPSQLNCEIPTGIRRSMEAFWRDLPQLLPLQSRQRQWVAYHGDERVGFGRGLKELHCACLRRGLKDDEFYVGKIEPHERAPWEEEEIEPSFAQLEDMAPEQSAG